VTAFPTGQLLRLNSYLYGLDSLSATDNNGVRTYFLQDGLGSTTGLTDDDGSMTATYQYDAFGAVNTKTDMRFGGCQ
jgi:YD repeat-containing protein